MKNKNQKLIDLSKKTIDAIFADEKYTKQSEVVTALYEIAIPDFCSENVLSVSRYPTVSEETSKYIFGKCIDFDKKFHPNVMNGGLWLNNGFSSKFGMEDWKISMADCVVERKIVPAKKRAA